MISTKVALGIGVALAGAACVRSPEGATERPLAPAARMEPVNGRVRLYAAELLPVNQSVRGGADGTATFVMQNDRLDVTLDVDNLAPGPHIAHVQGFVDDRDAECPVLETDTNGDDIIDATEAAAMSGRPLIPINASLESLELHGDDYPRAAQTGRLHFEESVSLAGLQTALRERAGSRGLALDRHVVMLYGLPQDVELPASVQTMTNQPPHASVPVACGVITRIR